ncbi:MAG: tRNA pseudouridine(55) synthase TruB [Clostridia bacterium]|nr:tRNA pseudouridine(55) synthase TruB [Clostridia bacterium]
MRTGIINIDKSEGMNSTRVVSAVKRLTHVSGCGHMGTLDPMASGVLPVAVGNATRLFDFFLAKRKTYLAEFAFGLTSDTLDITGRMEEAGRIPSAGEIEAALPQFTGEIEQLPPRYSAKRINGRRGYDLAREGQEFDLKPAKVTIYSFSLLPQAAAEAEAGRFRFEIECGGGTYIRSLARDLGQALGTSAVMSALRRTRSGPFTLENAVRLEELTEDNIEGYVMPAQDLLDMPEVHVEGRREQQLLCGVCVDSLGLKDGLYKMFLQDGSFYGLCRIANSGMKVVKKLC